MRCRRQDDRSPEPPAARARTLRVVGQHPIEWVSAILELLDDPAQRQRLADSGRRRLAADYSRETVRDQLLEVVDSLQPAR